MKRRGEEGGGEIGRRGEEGGIQWRGEEGGEGGIERRGEEGGECREGGIGT